jgi:meso-butanediol dehydrogenase/(S,S)-butanediol dehydrogenase/diacetyl reductase
MNLSNQRFKDRVAYITGGASGVGRATAQHFAAEGARVFAVDLNETGLGETVAAIRNAGGVAESAAVNVADMAAVRASVEAAVKAFGRLDVLINAAGAGRTARFEEIDEQEWHKVLGVNLHGPFNTTKAAIAHLLTQPGSSIVNVASIAGMRGQAYNSHYAASKAGLINFTRSIATEFASRGLRANCICPGGIKTPFIRNFIPREDFERNLVAYYSPPIPHQLCEPADIAKLIAFVASDDAKYMNGTTLVSDGGTLA